MNDTDDPSASVAGPRLSTLSVEAVGLFLALRIGLSLLGAFMATTRYVLVLFPLFVVAALLTEHPGARRAWIVLSLLFMGALATLFLEGDFVA